MADPTDPQVLAKLTSIENLLHDAISGRNNTINKAKDGQTELKGIDGLSAAIKDLKTDIGDLTGHIGSLVHALGGRISGGAGRHGSQVNANLTGVEGGGGIGLSSFRYDPFSNDPQQHLRYGNIPRAISTKLNGLIEDNRPLAHAQSLVNNVFGAVPAIRGEWNNINGKMQASVDRRITNPTQLGMLAGYQGPGQEGIQSSTGSYLSSLFAAPSLVLSGGSDAGMIGNMFGANMSPATQAGWQSQYRAFSRSLNPMDMLSYSQALGINQAVASKGFRSLGQQVSVEDAVTQIVQTTAIDAGTAIDTMDLVIKRLHGDVSDANDMLKQFGTLAVGAGKGVNQFAQEANQVIAGISMQGAQGTGAVQAGAAYSMFTGISGPAVSQFLNSPQLGGLMAAQIIGGGGKFDNPQDIMSLAMGFSQSMGGGQSSVDVFGQQVGSVVSLVETFKKQGYNEQMAIQLAASTTGQQPLMIQQIYKQGPKIVKEQKVLASSRAIAAGYDAHRESIAGRQSYAIGGNTQDKNAFRGIDLTGKSNKMGVRYGGMAVLGEIKRMTRAGGVDFNRFNIGDKDDPNFEDKVQRLYSAHMGGDMQDIKNVLNQIENEPGTNIEKVKEAVNLLVSSGKSGAGETRDWQKLASKYGITMRMGAEHTRGGGFKPMVWDSTKGTVDPTKILAAAKPVLDQAVEAGIINKRTEKSWIEKIKNRELDPKEINRLLNDKETQKRLKDEGGVSIKLEGDAAKYFKLFQGDSPGSNQRYVKTGNPSGYDNRSGG